ncbi:MAG: hypothetical protein R3D80_14245 [Paracoccaceae bacterium]
MVEPIFDIAAFRFTDGTPKRYTHISRAAARRSTSISASTAAPRPTSPSNAGPIGWGSMPAPSTTRAGSNSPRRTASTSSSTRRSAARWCRPGSRHMASMPRARTETRSTR